MVGAARYPRQVLDHYPTIDVEVTRVLLPVLAQIGFRSRHVVWECAAGAGDMARVLLGSFPDIIATDVAPKHEDVDTLDFLDQLPPDIDDIDLIVTNPPYLLCDEFFVRCRELAEARGIHAFMICRNEFDSASDAPRAAVIDSPFFRGKFPLRWRPKWFEDDPEEQKRGSPRHNYAWFWIGPGLGDPVIQHLDRDKTIQRRARRAGRPA